MKIRGFRVEPGEVEAVLAAHARGWPRPSVTAREDARGDRRLVAYLVPAAGSAGGKGWPRRCGRTPAGLLPEYMVPAAIVVLDELPLTAHGKVDRAGAARPGSPGGRGGPGPGDRGGGAAVRAVRAGAGPGPGRAGG